MPLAHLGPGFKQHILEEMQRVDRALDLAWCNFRKHWVVVRRAGPRERAFWNGLWHSGWTIEVRWSGVDGVYRAAYPHEKTSFLPLDNRLVLLMRACDLSRRRKASDRWQEAEDVDDAREKWRLQRRRDRRAEAQAYAHNRHVLNRTTSIAGLAPGLSNDHQTEEEARQEITARMRRAMNRVRTGLPWESRID